MIHDIGPIFVVIGAGLIIVANIIQWVDRRKSHREFMERMKRLRDDV